MKNVPHVPSCLCGARHGQFHKPSCGYEECPFCHTQLIGCDCRYILLGLDQEKEPTYSHGLNNKQRKQWEILLRKKGLIRHGYEIQPKAYVNWNDVERKKLVSSILEDMIACATKKHTVSSNKVTRWSERLNALTTATSVFLEMNREHVLRGKPIKWRPLTAA